MPANRIRKTDLIPAQDGGSVGFVLDKDAKRLAYKDDSDVVRFVSGATVEAKTASFTITSEDDGKVFLADSTSSVVATLPAASADTKGMRVALAVKQLTTSGGHAFSPAAADKIIGNGFTAADDKDAICSAASDRVGDVMWLQCDGDEGWYIISVIGTWAREA